MLLVAASALVGVFLTESQLPQTLAKSIVGITSNPYMVLLLLNVFFLILGHVPAFGGGDHPHRADRDAAGARRSASTRSISAWC